MRRYFSVPNTHLYRGQYPSEAGDGYAYLWPFSQALMATLYLVGMPTVGKQFVTDAQGCLLGLAHYWNPWSPLRPLQDAPALPGYASSVVSSLGFAGDLYYDDNEWVALALIEHYYFTEDQAALERAKQLFRLIIAGWDTNAKTPCPGGVAWNQALFNQDRCVISTAPAAALGVHLYTLTQQRTYLQWAVRMYDWVNQWLRAPNGLYWDHIDQHGTIDRDLWSYNQGTMLGAAVLLYLATRKEAYLNEARQIAERALTYYQRDGRWLTQPAAFNAIFFKNLLKLDAVLPNPRYRAALRTYTDTLWQAVDPSTSLLRQQPSAPATLLDQAALIQLLALLDWNREHYSVLA